MATAALNWCIFRHSVRLSSAPPEIFAFVSHCSVNFQPILDCFIPNLKYEHLENVKADCVNAVVFNLDQIKASGVFFGTPGMFLTCPTT